MMVTLYRREPDGSTRYVTITDRQRHLFGYPTLTVIDGKDFFLVRERHHTYADEPEQQRSFQGILKRRLARGYSVLYSYFRAEGPFRRSRDLLDQQFSAWTEGDKPSDEHCL